MDKSQELRQIVADLMRVDPAQIAADTKLNGQRISGSLGRSILDAAIRKRLGVTNPNVHLVKTFGELESAVLGTASAPANASAAPAPASNPTGGAGLSCGVDMESVESLPQTQDYPQTDFYKTHFTKTEIDYCSRQEQPREHFAARWCAKEALKKCDSRFAKSEFGSIEVVADASGKPSFRYLSGSSWKALPHALSLSHTPQMAIAFVVMGSAGLLASGR